MQCQNTLIVLTFSLLCYYIHAENGVVSLSLGAAVAITAVMEGLIFVTIFGSLVVLVYSCAKRNNRVKSKGIVS